MFHVEVSELVSSLDSSHFAVISNAIIHLPFVQLAHSLIRFRLKLTDKLTDRQTVKKKGKKLLQIKAETIDWKQPATKNQIIMMMMVVVIEIYIFL